MLLTAANLRITLKNNHSKTIINHSSAINSGLLILYDSSVLPIFKGEGYLCITMLLTSLMFLLNLFY